MGAWFLSKGSGVGGGRGGAALIVRGNYEFFKGIYLTVLERMHQFIMGGEGGDGWGISICSWKLYIL